MSGLARINWRRVIWWGVLFLIIYTWNSEFWVGKPECDPHKLETCE